jgi:predicted nucleic acid-binding protein
VNLFIDTNVFLSFFHLSNDDLEELHKLAVLIEKGEITLWLSDQVKDEFKRNRENKVADAVKKLKEQKSKPQFPQICKDYEEYAEIRELQKEYEKKLSSLTKKVNEDISRRTLKADQKISELFHAATAIETTQELVNRACFRMDVRNPPGKDGSLGDAINWEGLLESVPDNEVLHLVADDRDYYSVLDENKLKDFLQDEWTEKKGESISFYRRLSQFFKEHYPDIKLASELEKELSIRSLINSGNFASTHSAIAKLSKYSEFNKSQVNEIVQIAISNNQVNWIICDQDVYEFYSALIDNHDQLLDEELKAQITDELKACNPEDNDA